MTSPPQAAAPSGPTETPIPQPAPITQPTARRYLTAFFLLPLIFFILPFLLERIPPLRPWINSYWANILDHNYHEENINADIVLFGDSTAVFNIDPVLLSRDLHLKVVILPNAIASLPTTNDETLKLYLAHNRQPRLIVFYFCPWDVDYKHAPSDFIYEGEEMRLRYGTLRQIARFYRDHPAELVLFPFRFWITPSKLTSLPHKRPPVAFIDGHSPLTTNEPLEPGCILPSSLLGHTRVDSTLALVHEFRTPATEVITHLSPIPNCLHASEVHLEPSELGVTHPTLLPPADFGRDVQYTHMRSAFIGISTAELATRIRTELATH